MYNFDLLEKQDQEIAKIMKLELKRQVDNIELIASENYVSKAVMYTMGSFLTNKYAEGYPKKRYYGGCTYIDEIEQLAIDRAKKLFGAEHANVQPHSGANANLATFFAFLKPNDTILSMNLNSGGHLSHGSPVNISGKYFNVVSYGLNENEQLDYNEIEDLAKKHKPKLILAGASAYPRKIDFEKFATIKDKVGAILMVDIAHIAGLIVASLHQSPIPYADVVTATTHKTLRGPRGGLILCKEKHKKVIDKAVFPGTQGGPLMHIIASKAVAFLEAMTDEYKEYQTQVVKNAKALSKKFLDNDVSLVSGGTDNHLLLLKLSKYQINGKELEQFLDEINISTNKNSIPNDPLPPTITSGVRLGTPAVTTRGMKEKEMDEIAEIIINVIKEKNKNLSKLKNRVLEINKRFPLAY